MCWIRIVSRYVHHLVDEPYEFVYQIVADRKREVEIISHELPAAWQKCTKQANKQAPVNAVYKRKNLNC